MKVIKFMADYQCYPLWDMSSGMYGDIDPESLPISRELKASIAKWANDFDLTLNEDDPMSSGFKTIEEEFEFKKRGRALIDRLREELGSDYEVIEKI